MSGPYAQGADLYWSAGWRGILPLPARSKTWPPKTYTGGGGIDPSYPDLRAWADGNEGAGNICLRLPIDVIGIDVDAYDDKAGAKTLAAAEKANGPLPPTWRTTSRDDGVSGIRLYRVPPGMSWEQIGPGIETIQRIHRYAVVWPSIHPEGRTYRWIAPDGVVSTVIPHVDELPSLPDKWVTAYVRGEASDVRRNSMPSTLAAAWLAGLPNAHGDPCKRVSESVTADVVTLQRASTSAHDAGCQATARLVRLAAEGHSGVLRVMGSVHRAFSDNVTNPRRGGKVRTQGEAENEWRDLIVSAVNLVSADMPTAPSCDCDGQLTALIVGGRNAPPVQGTAALAVTPETAPLVAEEPDSDRTSWWPRELEPILSGEQTEPPPTVLTRNDGQALWYAGKINGLIGESESGKTWVALLAVAQELRAGHRVLYLDFEDAAPGIVSRLIALGVDRADLRRFLDYADPAESLHAAASGDLGELLRDRSYSLIVVDGFNAAMTLLGLDLMSNTDVTKFFQLLLKPLSATGSAVAYVDHIGKNAQDDSKGGIGAQAKRAMTTGCVIKVKVGDPFGRGMTGRLGLHVDKDRAGHVRGASNGGRNAGVASLVSDMTTGSVVVTLEAPDMVPQGQKSQAKRWELMERISDHLNTGPERTSMSAVRKAMTGARDEDVDGALNELVDRNYVAREKHGISFRHHLLRRYQMAENWPPNNDHVPASDHVPTMSRTGSPKPSVDHVPASRIYIRDADGVTEAAAGRDVDRVPYDEADCNRCGHRVPLSVIEAFKGLCQECARKDGQL